MNSASVGFRGIAAVSVRCPANELARDAEREPRARRAESPSRSCVDSVGQLRREALQPWAQLGAELWVLARELDRGLDVLELVTGVVATSVVDDTDHSPERLRVAGEDLECVGELDLAAAPWRRAFEHLKDLRAKKIPPDDREVRWRILAGGLLDEARELDRVGAYNALLARDARVIGGNAVGRDLVELDLLQCDDAGAGLLVHLDHPLEQGSAGGHDVVTEEHGEGLVTDVLLRAEDGVTEAEGVTLAEVVDVGEVRRRVDASQLLVLTAGLEERLELGNTVEVVLEGGLMTTRDHEHV